MLTYAATWMKFEDVPSEISQIQKDNCYSVPQNSQIRRDRKWDGGCQGLQEEENGELVSPGDRVPVCNNNKALERDGDDDCTTV